MARLSTILRPLVLSLLVAAAAVAIYFATATEPGRRLVQGVRSDPLAATRDLRDFASRHPVVTPLLFFATVLASGLCGLPVQWTQIIAGVLWGVIAGTLIVLLCSATTALATLLVSRWLGRAWFERRVESRLAALRRLDRSLGGNGLLVVMTMRLLPITPFALGNYAMGLLSIRPVHAFLGTLIGGLPLHAWYASLGDDASRADGRYLQTDWRFWAILLSLTALCAAPVVAGYLRNRRREPAPAENAH